MITIPRPYPEVHGFANPIQTWTELRQLNSSLSPETKIDEEILKTSKVLSICLIKEIVFLFLISWSMGLVMGKEPLASR